MHDFYLEPFSWETHGAVYSGWFKSRGVFEPEQKFISPTGFMVYSSGSPICAGFLSLTDNNVAMITNFISDEKCNKETRSQAVDFLIDRLVDLASSFKGIDLICASTNLTHVKDRFLNHDFHVMDDGYVNLGRRI